MQLLTDLAAQASLKLLWALAWLSYVSVLLLSQRGMADDLHRMIGGSGESVQMKLWPPSATDARGSGPEVRTYPPVGNNMTELPAGGSVTLEIACESSWGPAESLADEWLRPHRLDVLRVAHDRARQPARRMPRQRRCLPH